MKILTSIFILILLLFNKVDYSQWQQTTLNSGNVRAVTGNENRIYAANSVVFYSTDNGDTWISTGFGSTVQDLLFVNNIIYAAVQNAGVYRSTNDGENWSYYPMGADGVRSLSSSGNVLFAGQQNYGVMRSSNSGLNWTWIANTSGTHFSIESNGSYVFAGKEGGVVRTSNLGENWSQVLSIPYSVVSIAVNGDMVFAGTSSAPGGGGTGGIYISSNNGINWIQSSLNNVHVYSLATIGQNVFAGTFGNGIYLSRNNGLNWVQINEGLTNLNIEDIYIRENYIFAASLGGGLFRRTLSELVGISQISSNIPKEFSLSQNYPNPFNPVTIIEFSLPKNEFAKLVIYDAAGREVETLVNSQLNAGTYKIDWSAGSYPSGVYFYSLTAGSFTKTNKMVLVK